MEALHRHALPRVGAEMFGPGITCAVAAILLLAIAAIDKLTGWELRLQILYLVPVSLVAWAAGRAWGLVAAALSVGLWLALLAFAQAHSIGLSYYWDAAVSLITLAAFALLIDRLHQELRSSSERLHRTLDLLDGSYRLKQVDGGRKEEADHAKGDPNHA
jgi:membrane protein implicated in regulation of membrane protease activity